MAHHHRLPDDAAAATTEDDEVRREREERERVATERRIAMLQRGPVNVQQRVIPLGQPPLPAALIGVGATPLPATESTTDPVAVVVDDDDNDDTSNATATTTGHRYYATEGVITMPVVGNMPPPPPDNATPEQIANYNRRMVVARRQQALEEHLDLVYRFVGWVAHDLGQGYVPEQFWKGEASGRGALQMLLHRAAQHWMDQSALLDPNALSSRDGQFHARAAMQAASNTRIMEAPHGKAGTFTVSAGSEPRPSAAASSSSSSSSSSAATAATLEPASPPPRLGGLTAKEVLGRMLMSSMEKDGAPITETAFRVYDSIFFHDGEYIPPNGHPVQTPREEVELALKFAQLERFFHASDVSVSGAVDDDSDPSVLFGHSVVVDNRIVHEVFLDSSMQKGIVDATLFVHNVCHRAHLAQIDLMTHERVAPNFSRLVASKINEATELNPRRPTQPLVMRAVAKNERGLRKFFEHVDYADDGYLADMRVYDPDAEQRRYAIEQARAQFTQRTGRYYSDAGRGAKPYRARYTLATDSSTVSASPTEIIGVSLTAPAPLGQAMAAARQRLSFSTGRGGTLMDARPAVTPSNFSIVSTGLSDSNPYVVSTTTTTTTRTASTKRGSDRLVDDAGSGMESRRRSPPTHRQQQQERRRRRSGAVPMVVVDE